MTENPISSGAAAGGVCALLRLEGLALLALAAAFYAWLGGPWWLFVTLFLAPDLSFLAYLAGPRIGAAAYNSLHATIGPVALLAVSALVDAEPALFLALIWAAHVGLDRALGYGLKYGSGFAFTHLGRIGRG